jgi:hypothetical protein
MNIDFCRTDIPQVVMAQEEVLYSIISEIHIPMKLVGLTEMFLDESIYR